MLSTSIKSNLPRHVKYQIVNRIEGNHLFLNIESHQRVTTRQDISNGQEHIPVRIATDAPEPEVSKILNSFNQKGKGKRDSHIYIDNLLNPLRSVVYFHKRKVVKMHLHIIATVKVDKNVNPPTTRRLTIHVVASIVKKKRYIIHVILCAVVVYEEIYLDLDLVNIKMSHHVVVQKH